MIRLCARGFSRGCLLFLAFVFSALFLVPSYADVGRIAGTFNVSPNGAATYSIPIWAPPGPRGLQPHVSLVYNSRQQNSYVGVGWSLTGLSSIYRCTLTYAQDSAPAPVALAQSDGLCLDGQRLRLTAGTYGAAGSTYQTEIADFSVTTANGTAGNGPSYFTVARNDGSVYTYGNGGNSQVLPSTTGATTALAWLLNKVTDASGNTMTITYTTATGAAVPNVISWTPSAYGSSSYNYTMTFGYGTNVAKSTASGYVAGSYVTNPYLLSSITVKYGSTVVKYYSLGYTASTTTARDELTTIQECADSAASDCLGTTTITYQSGTGGVSTATSGTVSGSASAFATQYDFDGNGRTDLAYVGSTGDYYVALNNGSGFGSGIDTGITKANTLAIGDILGTGQDGILANNSGTIYYYIYNSSTGTFQGTSTGLSYNSSYTQYTLADLDGDGRPDLAAVSSNTVVTTANTSSGSSPRFSSTWTTAYTPSIDQSSATITQFTLLPKSTANPSRARYLDFNGDGRQDLFVQLTVAPLPSGTIYYLNSELLSNGVNAAFTTASLPSGTSYSAVFFANWNSDQCTDAVAWTTVYISGCNGSLPTSFTLPSGPVVAAMDWDGDGLTDIVIANGSYLGVYYSNGSGVSSLQTTSIAYGGSTGSYYVLDANADALDDLAFVSSAYALSYSLHNGAGTPPDLMSEVLDGYGNYAKPTYVTIANNNYSPYTDATYPYRDYQGSYYVVNAVTFNDPTNPSTGTYQWTYWYAGAWLNLQGRGFSGFEAAQRYDSRNGVWETWQYGRQFPYTGMLIDDGKTENNTSTTQISLTTNTLGCTILSETATCSPPSGTTSQRYFPYVANSTTQSYELGSTSSAATRLVTSSSTNTTYDAYGNVLTVGTTVTDNDANSPYYGKSWTTSITNTPDTGSGVGCTSLLTESVVTYSSTQDASSVTRTKTLTPNTTTCLYTQVVTEPNSSTYKVTEAIGYDSFGNLDSDTVTGINMTARVSSTSWGATGQFPVTVTDASGATTTIGYNYSFGVPSSVTDANSVVTSWTYDGFGRKIKESRPDGTSTTWGYATCSGCDPKPKSVITQLTLDTTGATITQNNYYGDMLDRIIYQMGTQLDGTGVWTKLTYYDSLGRVASSSFPYATSGSSPGSESYTYDVLNRILTDSRPMSASNSTLQSTTYTYAGRKTTVTDPLGHATIYYADVNGNRRETQDPKGYLVTMGYDAAGSLNSVTDNESNTLWSGTYAYGLSPFLVTAHDMDLGAWSFTVDALGEQTGWTDAKGQSFSETYDALSRPLTRTEPDLYTKWTWGASASSHNWGQLVTACTGTGTACSSSAYSETKTYDSLGRISQRAINVPVNSTATTFSYTWAYNATTGLLDTLTYPASSTASLTLKVQYGYTHGILSSVKDITDSPNVTLWTANTANAAGQITEETLGNGVITNRTYDVVTHWLSSIQSAVSGGTALQNQAFLYDEVGNVSQRQDNNRSLTENVYYDADNRFSYSTLGGTTNLSITYDNNGNILTRSDIASGATWTYDSTHKHAVTQAGSSSYAYVYDANGNMSTRQGSSISWASYNYPTAISAGSGTTAESVSFSYGPDRQRWLQSYSGNSTTESTLYLGGMYEEILTGTSVTGHRNYVYVGNRAVAVYSVPTGASTATVSYLLTDHQSSVSSILNSSGTALVSESFTAFGARRSPTTWSGAPPTSDLTTAASYTRQGYTFQTQLGLWMGLNHMNGRVEDAITGRFLSPDPYVTDPMNTQNYNRYSYVYSNPLTYTDPSGFYCIPQYAMVDNWGPDEDGSGLISNNPTFSYVGNFCFPDPDYTNLLANAGTGSLSNRTPPTLLPTISFLQEQPCAPSLAHSQCVADCNKRLAWIGSGAGGAVGGGIYGALMGWRVGGYGALAGGLAGILGGGFAGIATTAYGGAGPVATGIAGAASSMIRNAGSLGGNVISGMAGGVTTGAVNAVTGLSVDASASGAMVGAVAGGSLSASAILGAGSAATVGAISGLAMKSYVDGLVNNYCESHCGQ